MKFICLIFFVISEEVIIFDLEIKQIFNYIPINSAEGYEYLPSQLIVQF